MPNATPETVLIAPRRSATDFQLSPIQFNAYSSLVELLDKTPIVVIQGATGLGKTTVLRHLQGARGGRILGMREVVNASSMRDPIGFEESFASLVNEAFASSDLVMVDDIDVISAPSVGHNGTRKGFIKLAIKAICDTARRDSKSLIFSVTNPALAGEVIEAQAAQVTMAGFGQRDYAAIAKNLLPDSAEAKLDFARIYRYASKLQAYQLRIACELNADKVDLSTDAFISGFEGTLISSNTRVTEVEKIEFKNLKGAEKIIELLRINVILPMENDALARQLGLKPKRGVLLFGPPGTGKTSIGRALAHSMKGKFFIIDGTFISEPPAAFFSRVRKVFEDAKANSPAVIFIDDADVLFKTDHVYGLNRYLLTMLDGLESETAGNVCVMMTAMNVKDMPPALLRSGRVELWLETKLPPKAIREEILSNFLKEVPSELGQMDFTQVDRLTDGFTPADLRRIAGDVKALYAYDVSTGMKPMTTSDYLVKAAKSVLELKQNIAASLGYTLPRSSDLDAVSGCGC